MNNLNYEFLCLETQLQNAEKMVKYWQNYNGKLKCSARNKALWRWENEVYFIKQKIGNLANKYGCL